jgi:DNA-binding CsgD family transcriptional regulator
LDLPQREKAILSLRQQGMTLQDIGNSMKITRERVRQLEEQAKRKLNISRELAEKLYKRVIPCFITEEEFESAFLRWYSEVMGRDYMEAKSKWQEILKIIWDEKQKK